MAEGQRRRILDTGVGANLLSALSGGVVESITQRRKADQELRAVLAKALAEEQLKEQFDPERRAKRQAETLIPQLYPEPTAPTLRMGRPGGRTTFTPTEGEPTPISPLEQRALASAGLQSRISTPEARHARLQEAFGQRQQEFEQAKAERQQNLLAAMQKYGLLPRAPLSLEDITAKATATAVGRTQGEMQGLGLTGTESSPTVTTPGGETFERTEFRVGGQKFEQTPERAGERKATAEVIQKEFERASKLGGTVRQLTTIADQFNQALPTGERTALEQRFVGLASRMGATTGLAPNPQLLALLTNSRLEAIQLIRAFGEVGNLSESEQQSAIAAWDQAGQTEEERFAKLQQLGVFTLSSLSPRARQFLLRENPDIADIMGGLGIDLTSLGKANKPAFLQAASTPAAGVPTVGQTFQGQRVLKVRKLR